MKDKLERQAKKDYEKLSKDIKELFTEDDYIKEVFKRYQKIRVDL